MSKRPMPTILTLPMLVAVCALAVVAGCRSKKKTNDAPIPEPERQALTGFIKVSKCEPRACDEVACVRVSDGQSDGTPAHLVRCRWTDKRTATSGTPLRCAFVHYTADPTKGLGNMFGSEPSFGDGCVPDKAFVDLLKKDLHYSGDLP